MDYLAFLPVELWSLIIGSAVDHVGVNWPPSDRDPSTFCLLDATYGRAGDSTPRNFTRSSIRLACRSFKLLADHFPLQEKPRLRSDSLHLMAKIYESPGYSALTGLAVSLHGVSNQSPLIEDQLRNLWRGSACFPHLRALTIDTTPDYWASDGFWRRIDQSFPQIDSLAIRNLTVTRSGTSTWTLSKLRHLYLPDATIGDLPHLPRLQMLRADHIENLQRILGRLPSLSTLSVLSSDVSQPRTSMRTRIRYFRCIVTNVSVLKLIDTSAAEDKLELLVLTVPGTWLRSRRYSLSQSDIPPLVFEIYKRRYSNKIHLDFAPGFAGSPEETRDACIRRGVRFDRMCPDLVIEDPSVTHNSHSTLTADKQAETTAGGQTEG